MVRAKVRRRVGTRGTKWGVGGQWGLIPPPTGSLQDILMDALGKGGVCVGGDTLPNGGRSHPCEVDYRVI